jgi:uncharacterized repeat protein (TIGR02543 family)
VGILFCASHLSAAPVTADVAAKTIQGWLRQDRHPLAKGLSANIKNTKTVNDANGQPLYHVVELEPSGYVIVPADDEAEPIVAFSAKGKFDAASGSPMADFVNRDLPKRMAKAKANGKTRSNWQAFLAGSRTPPPDSEYNWSIVLPSQVWVPPMLATEWGQQLDDSLTVAVFNYFTPPGSAGDVKNDPCGCVATALAQEMFYFQYPNTAVGTASFTITNGTTSQTVSLLGGNGTGGVYQWSQMPLSPTNPTPTEAQAIGYLTHDAGAAVHMTYKPDLSSAYTAFTQKALLNTFKFSSAAYYENLNNGVAGTNLQTMINPSLDAHSPVILGIEPDGGHCVVADGYGYSASILFHHLNFGFNGDDDVWYALPEMNTIDGQGEFSMVEAVVYNIFTNGTGQIISGRVTDPTGAAVAGATVTADTGGGTTYSTTTDTNGIYALQRIPGATTYTVTVANVDGITVTNSFTTGISTNNQLPSGNVWGANFVLAPTLLAIPEAGFSSIGPVGGPFSVNSQFYDLTNSSAAAISWTNSALPAWLTISTNNGTVAPNAISILTIGLSPAAASEPAGTYTASVWITNLFDGTAQALNFSLAVETANYPLAVTGYNRDVIIEASAVGGDTTNYADAFDPNCAFLETSNATPVCFYGAGLPVTNILEGGFLQPTGLPINGIITNLADGTTFQLGPYDNYNVLYLTPIASSGTLTLPTPEAFSSLSVMAASADGGGPANFVINFTDGTTSTQSYNASDYLSAGVGAVITNFGLAVLGDFTEFGVVNDQQNFPSLYQTTVPLSGGLAGKRIKSVTFLSPTGAAATGIFALSGTEVTFAGSYNVTATASPSGAGVANVSGSATNNSIDMATATANPGFAFANWTLGGVIVSTSSNYTFTVSGDEPLVANFLGLYTLAVDASPAGEGSVSAGGTFLQGSQTNVTATPDSGFEFIGWTGDATGTANPLTVIVNTNMSITANFASNGSTVNFTVITNNQSWGRVTPDLNGKDLTSGHKYTLTATAASGYVFSNWTGTITTNKDPLTLKAESNMVLQANFVLNPFLVLKGIYNGLFYDTNNGVTEQTAGMLKGLTISTKGAYSGTLMINGAAHAIGGAFNLGGQATNVIKRSNAQGGNVAVTMTVNDNDGAPQITGTVSGLSGAWQSALTADRATNIVHSAQFTLLIPPDADNNPPDGSPAGNGYALITNKSGTAVITGALADGVALNESTSVSGDGYVPVYANLYNGKGLLLGWINLVTNASDESLTWAHPTARSGLYTNGFTNVALSGQLLLSQWTNPPANLGLLTNLYINGTNAIPVEITGDTIKGTDVVGTVNNKTGLLTVTIGSGPSKITAHGAIVLSQPLGRGYFTTKTNAQAISLGP